MPMLSYEALLRGFLLVSRSYNAHEDASWVGLHLSAQATVSELCQKKISSNVIHKWEQSLRFI